METPALLMIDVVDGIGISTSSPVAEVKRTLSDSPYTSAVAMTRRRGTIARRATQCFQAIACLRPLSMFMPQIYGIGAAAAPARLTRLQRDCC
ncbi:hypothetical protein XH83_26940 [Bradyrhizobium sp. CCBAU 53351]|nr:hypothetical protein XH83_26940 [Bradyrhizobium sp. CCBAU 53351]